MIRKLITALSLVAAFATTAFAQELLVIKGAKIIPISGEPIENGLILIKDGRIDKVGSGFAIPVEAKVIDASGKVVMPGIVEVHSSSAMSQSNENNPNVPFLSVVDSIDPSREFFEESRRNGVTTAAVVPGNSTMIGGQAAVIKTAGSYVDDMVLKRNGGLKLSVAPTGTTSRMSHYSRLRKELEKVRDAEKEKAEAEAKKKAEEKKDDDKKKDGDKDLQVRGRRTPATPTPSTAQQPTDDAQKEALRSLLKGEMSAYIYCAEAMDVAQALRLVEEFKLKSILVLGRNTYKAAGAVADAKIPAILDSTLVYWRTDPRTREDEKIILTKLFSEKGVDYSFQVNDSTSRLAMGSHYHWYQAATAVKYGMSTEDALEKLTLGAARLLGVDEFVGSIEAGKDADLVILSGDPLKVATWVETTIVNGKIVYERDKDVKLQKLLNPKKDEE